MTLNSGQSEKFQATEFKCVILQKGISKFPDHLGNSIPTNFRKEFYEFFSFETAEIDEIICF